MWQNLWAAIGGIHAVFWMLTSLLLWKAKIKNNSKQLNRLTHVCHKDITVLGLYSVLKLLVTFLLHGGDSWSCARQQKRSSFTNGTYYDTHYLTGQNQGLSALKNIWLVIMTGDLLSIIFSPGALNITIFWWVLKTWKGWPNFFKFQFISIFAIHFNRRQETVSKPNNSHKINKPGIYIKVLRMTSIWKTA